MEAISYLLKRHFPSALVTGSSLILSTICGWLAIQLSTTLPRLHPHLFQYGFYSLGWSLLVVLGGVLSFGSMLLLTLMPVYASHLIYRLLKAWKRQGILDELMLANLSGKQVVDSILKLGIAWLAISTYPAALASIFFVQQKGLSFSPAWAMMFYLVASIALISLSLSLATAPHMRSKHYDFLFSPAIWLILIPALGILISLNFKQLGWIAACFYSCMVARLAAIRNLEGLPILKSAQKRAARSYRLDYPTSLARLPSNAIAARQAMRLETNRAPRALAGLTAITVAIICHNLNAVWPVFFLIFPAIILINLRSTLAIANAINLEREHATLDTMRSTPIKPSSFLYGWSIGALRLAWLDSALILGVCSILVLSLKQEKLLLHPLIAVVICLSLQLPVLSVCIGAALAGLNKKREELLGLAFIIFAVLGAVIGPQFLAFTQIFSLSTSIISLTLAIAASVTILCSIAKRRLEEVLAPQ